LTAGVNRQVEPNQVRELVTSFAIARIISYGLQTNIK
jgi:hypothetical protein